MLLPVVVFPVGVYAKVYITNIFTCNGKNKNDVTEIASSPKQP